MRISICTGAAVDVPLETGLGGVGILVMPLTIEQRESLVDALVNAFADGRSFASALLPVGIDLAAQMDVSRGKHEVASEAIFLAENGLYLDRIVTAAVKAAPSNLALRTVAESLQLRSPDTGRPPVALDRLFGLRLLESTSGFTIIAKDVCVGSIEAKVSSLPRALVKEILRVPDVLLQTDVEQSAGNPTRGFIKNLNRKAERKILKELGEDIFRFIITSEVASLFAASRKAAAVANVRLRIALDLTEAPSLTNIPWELAYDPTYGDHLCLYEFTPMSRQVQAPLTFVRTGKPLQILGMVAKPRLANEINLIETLESEKEQTNITRALGSLEDGRVKLHWTTAGTRAELGRRLRSPPEGSGWDVFHFIGHGGYNNSEDEGFLFFEQAGGVDEVSGLELRRLLARPGAPQLVVLNCCSGAVSGPGLPFSSVAATLLQGGIRAVIAMQFEVTERAAQIFSEIFYGQISEGETIQTALTVARQELDGKNLSEWVTPVLYLSGDDFALVGL